MIMIAPTEQEEISIKLFRERVKDILKQEELHDDYFLLRWIRAREPDLDKAETMLRTAVEWRIENKTDSILERKIDPFFSQTYPRWIEGHDKNGRPLYCAAIGKWDMRTVIKLGRSQEFLEYTTEGFELLLQAVKQRNEESKSQPPVTQIVAIFDFAEFPWGQLLNLRAVRELLQLGNLYEKFYPEILFSCYFINSPSLISKVFGLLKPVLAPKTMAKIRVFGVSKEEWLPELLKIIDENQLVPEFGGTKGLILDQLSNEH